MNMIFSIEYKNIKKNGRMKAWKNGNGGRMDDIRHLATISD